MMKKYALIVFLSFVSASLFAQDMVTSFLEKHRKDDALEVVTIGKTMFGRMDEISVGDLDVKEFIDGLDNIQIVTSKDAAMDSDYYSSAEQLLKKDSNFRELVTVDNLNEKTTMMIKESRGVVKELILLSGGSNGFSLISMTGDIDLEKLMQNSEKQQK